MDDDLRGRPGAARRDAPAAVGRRPGPARLRRPRTWSLATQLFAFQAAVILVVLVGAGLAAY